MKNEAVSLQIFFFDKPRRLIWSVPREIHFVLQSELVITLSDTSLEYLPTNVKDEPIICYDPPCKPEFGILSD